MIVPRTPVAAILAGSVSSIRVPVTLFKRAEQEWHDADTGEVRSMIPDPEGVVSLRAAQPRDEGMNPSMPAKGGRELTKLIILSADLVDLDDTTDQDAREDGYASLEEYELAYMDCYGKAWTGSQAFLIRFVIDRSEKKRTLYGVPWDPGTEDGQYRRMPEPEGVDELTLRRFSQDAEQRRAVMRGEKQALERLKRMSRTMREEGVRALRSGRDIAGPLERMQRELDALIEANRKAA